MKKLLYLFLFCFTLLPKNHAQQTVSAANRFLQSLSKEQQLLTSFPFDSEERFNYHFVPLTRKGISFNEMNEEQKTAALNLLQTCLSTETYQKSAEIRGLEVLLKKIEKRNPEDKYRDPENYHFSLFGIPSNTTVWGWRYEGHHQSFNFTFNKGIMVSGTPGFLGSNPGRVLEGDLKNKQILKEETDFGFQLVQSLDADQLKSALIDTAAPVDIISFDKKRIELYTSGGISFDRLNAAQQQLLLQLVKLYINRYTRLFADDMLKAIQADGLNKLRFFWAGKKSNEPGNGHYYRVQGNTLLIEYDNTQNNANHVHSVIRDLKNDFGGDALLEHYLNEHKK